jgi:hypothetical protein
MVNPVVITSRQLRDNPYLVWNEYVNFLASADRNELSHNQRPAFDVFWYESEVQNGGHIQYFENEGIERIDNVIDALRLLGGSSYAEVLSRAAEKYAAISRPKASTVEEFVELSLAGEFNSFDTEFHACSPTLSKLLEDYLEVHKSEFVVIVDDDKPES